MPISAGRHPSPVQDVNFPSKRTAFCPKTAHFVPQKGLNRGFHFTDWYMGLGAETLILFSLTANTLLWITAAEGERVGVHFFRPPICCAKGHIQLRDGL